MSVVDFFSASSLEFYAVLILRLVLACVLGGVVGYEREHKNSPAGFRTHILVCVGAALVMVTSEFIFKQYKGLTNLDPARLGAQVISGIGFLGAGTIIRDGFNVRGLTTAASLWAVSCVGIAAGIGFYGGAIAAAIIIYLTLILLKKFERYFLSRSRCRVMYIQSENAPELIGTINIVLSQYSIAIKSMEFSNNESEKTVLLRLEVEKQGEVQKGKVMDALLGIKGIKKVYEE